MHSNNLPLSENPSLPRKLTSLFLQVSNIADRGWLGPETTLATMSPLLKPKSDNPHATIVALFLNAVHEVEDPCATRHTMSKEIQRVTEYMPLAQVAGAVDRTNHVYAPGYMKVANARDLVRDYDGLFRQFELECRLGEVSKAYGAHMKVKNTIVKHWPMRLPKNGTVAEFNVLMASGHNGSERYVEWEKAT